MLFSQSSRTVLWRIKSKMYWISGWIFWKWYRGGDPFYKICLNGRVIEAERCPFNDTWNTPTFIYKRRCVSVYEIPVNEHQYGQLPSCLGKSDGSYQYPQEEHKCDAYFTCKNGTAKGMKCPGTQLFDVNTGFCREGAICRW